MSVKTSVQTEEPRLLVISNEPPWPAVHGARVDQWNRYQALQQEGWTQMLLYWREAGDAKVSLTPVFSNAYAIETDRSLPAQCRRLLRMLDQPSLAASRSVSESEFDNIYQAVREFGPDIIICEFVYCVGLARRLAKCLKMPLVIRSHNIEHRYMKTQLRLADNWRQRLQIHAARINLRRFETAALKSADAVLDISKSDAQFWRAEGIKDVHWVPIFFAVSEPAPAGHHLAWDERQFDIGYLGNLWAPNNVSAVQWFLDDILPQMRRKKPNLSVMVAGANPRPELASRIKSTPNVSLIENPESANSTRARVRVLINPIREGSGLNTKSVEMLYCDSPVVVTPFAIEGMDDGGAEAFVVAKNASEFAEAALAALAKPYASDQIREAARQRFGRGSAQTMSNILNEVVARGWDQGA